MELNRISLKPRKILCMVLILLFGIVLAYVLMADSKKKIPLYPPSSDFIISIKYDKNCVVQIDTNLGYTKMIDVSGVYSRKCDSVPRPVISPDGKYASFALNTTTNTLSMNPSGEYKPRESANNAEFVYLISKDKWFTINEHGAAETSKLTFLPNNNLQVDLFYEGKPAGSKVYEVEKQYKDKKLWASYASTTRWPNSESE